MAWLAKGLLYNTGTWVWSSRTHVISWLQRCCPVHLAELVIPQVSWESLSHRIKREWLGKARGISLWFPHAQVNTPDSRPCINHIYRKLNKYERAEGTEKCNLKVYFSWSQTRKGYSFDSSHLAIQCNTIYNHWIHRKTSVHWVAWIIVNFISHSTIPLCFPTFC